MAVVAFNIDYIGGANGFSGMPLNTSFGGVFLVLAILAFTTWRFDTSRLGYAARAVRDNPTVAAAMGINVAWVRVLVFSLGCAIAGLGGTFRGHYILVQHPEDMTFFFSLTFVMFWVFGGSYTFLGPLFGAMFLTIVPEVLRFSLYERYIMYGLVLTVMIIMRPQGSSPGCPWETSSACSGLWTWSGSEGCPPGPPGPWDTAAVTRPQPPKAKSPTEDASRPKCLQFGTYESKIL